MVLLPVRRAFAMLLCTTAIESQVPAVAQGDSGAIQEVLASLRIELRMMTGAQEGEWVRGGGYSKSLRSRTAEVDARVIWAGKYGWTAEASSPRYPLISCVMVSGWVPEEAWPQTSRDGLTGEVGAVACDGDTRVKPMTWSEYVEFRVRRVLDRVARGQHSIFLRAKAFSPMVDSLAEGSHDATVGVRLLWATAESWGAMATFSARPPLTCVLWEGKEFPNTVALPLEWREETGPPGITRCAGARRP